MIYSFLEDKVDVLESHILDLAVDFISNNQTECYIIKSVIEIYKLSEDKSLSKIENISVFDILNNKNDKETLYIISSKVDYINQDYSVVFGFGDDREIYKILELEEFEPSKRFFVFYFDKQPLTYHALRKPSYRKKLKGNFYVYCDKKSNAAGIEDDGFYSFIGCCKPERFQKFEYKPFKKDSEKIKRALKADFTGIEYSEDDKAFYVILDVICVGFISLLTLFDNLANKHPVGLCLLSILLSISGIIISISGIIICLFQFSYFFQNTFKTIGEIYED